MNEDKKHYVLKAGTGEIRVVPGSANLIANVATIAMESFASPTTETIIQTPSVSAPGQQGTAPPPPPPPRRKGAGTGAAAPPSPAKPPIVLSPHFKMIFLAVLALTILAGLALITLASIWTSPTELQKQAFSAMDFAWKAGLGAIFGLLGGKALK
jgi:hypothetical protein